MNEDEKEKKEKRNEKRKEKLAGFVFNLASLSFAGLVIGGLTPLFSDSASNASWWTIALGTMATITFAFFANKILK